jgi:hypothetical protein
VLYQIDQNNNNYRPSVVKSLWDRNTLANRAMGEWIVAAAGYGMIGVSSAINIQ